MTGKDNYYSLAWSILKIVPAVSCYGVVFDPQASLWKNVLFNVHF